MISLVESKGLKSIAILMMLFLHLFNNLNFNGLFEPFIYIGDKPLVYYLSLFCDSCVPIFAFVSGYGLYHKYNTSHVSIIERIKSLKWLYINLWLIILIFPFLMGFILKSDLYPGNLWDVLGNITGLNTTYNGAWWYFSIYVLFVLTCDYWFKFIDKINNQSILIVIFLSIYFIAFYFRIYKTGIFESRLLNWVYWGVSLYFCTLFQFMLGVMTLKFRWRDKISFYINKLTYRHSILIILLLMLVVLHSIVPNFIIAPFVAFAFIMIYLNIDKTKSFEIFILYFTPHSTNIWLIHMFFYMIFFKNFIYSFKYVLPIYIVLVLLCLIFSYVINLILNRMKYLDK